MSGLSSDEPVDGTDGEIEAPSTAPDPGATRDDRSRAEHEPAPPRTNGGDRRDTAGDERDHAADQRDEVAEQRDEAGVERDEAGVQRDAAGAQRDRAGERRDEEAERRDEASRLLDSILGAPMTAEIIERTAISRRAAASDRTRSSQDRRAGADERCMAQLDRGIADADRRAGAGERDEAELDRETALADRGASAAERAHSSHDALTGAYQRGAGFVELVREITRARRDDQSLVLAFLDVDGLKATNDAHGHARGDRMLRAVVDALRSSLRAHDLIIRYGGDEFVCAVAGVSVADARERLVWVNHSLAGLPEPASVTVGVAELHAGDSAEDLVARADDALYEERLLKGRGR